MVEAALGAPFLPRHRLFVVHSVLGHRARPSGMIRLDGLKVVASSPARFANPEAESPCSAAKVSSARHTSACFIAIPLPAAACRAESMSEFNL